MQDSASAAHESRLATAAFEGIFKLFKLFRCIVKYDLSKDQQTLCVQCLEIIRIIIYSNITGWPSTLTLIRLHNSGSSAWLNFRRTCDSNDTVLNFQPPTLSCHLVRICMSRAYLTIKHKMRLLNKILDYLMLNVCRNDPVFINLESKRSWVAFWAKYK